MKGTTTVSDFKDLKKAIEEITKNQPAETRYEKQAKVMGYTTKDTATVVVESLNEASAFDGMTKIVNDKQAQKVGGIMIDMFTASVILKAYTKVNASNKEKMKKANVHTLVALAQKVMGLNANYDNPLKGFPYNEVKESIMSENSMSDMLIDIQQGASAQELSKTYKMPLSTAKDFLKSYYGQKKGSRKESVNEAGMGDKIGKLFKTTDKKEIDGIANLMNMTDIKVLQSMMKQNPKGFKKMAKKMGELPAMEEVQEEKIAILTSVYKSVKREMDTLMKKHDAYVSDTSRDGTTISSPKPMKAFIKDVQKLIGLKEEVEIISEGTWQTPKDIPELKKLMTLVSKPVFATKRADVEKYVKQMPFGDDELYDALESLYYEKDSNGKIARPITVVSKFPKTDLNQVAMDSLNGRWLTVKKKGSGYDITHIMFDYDEVEEEIKRKSGSLKPKKKMTLDMSQDMTEDEISRAKDVIALTKRHEREKELEKDKIEKAKERAKNDAERAKNQPTESFIPKSPFKLKSKQYPRAIATESKGYGQRHATYANIEEACESFGMITDQELQIEQIQKTLGKSGFLTYNKTELTDIFEDRETQRMILALESVTETQGPTEYDRATIDRALEEELHVEFVKPDGMKAVGPVLKMSGNTYNLKDMHTGKSFTFKYIDEDTKVKTFNQIINEGKFPKKLVKMAGGIAFDKRYVGGNMTGAIKAIEKLKKGLSDDPSVRDMLKIANEAFNSQIFNSLATEDQDAYVKFFNSALKKFGVNSPADLDTEKKKEFFNYIDKNYKAKDEMTEGKYTAYSDLLLMKARIIDKEGPKSDKLPAVDSQIRIVMKRLGIKEDTQIESPQHIKHQCATHVEHAVFGAGTTVSGQHTLVQEDTGEYVVTHYDIDFPHGMEEMVSVSELAITKSEGHQHSMANKAGRKKLKASKKDLQSGVDGRRKNFREKMRKLGYIKGR